MDVLSASSPQLSCSPVGPLTDPSSRRLLINLICTLNASNPDHDFSNISVDQLSREKDTNMVITRIDSALETAYHILGRSYRERLWNAVDQVIRVHECEIYSFSADEDSEDSVDGRLWSFHVLFYNRKMKKVLLFSCASVMHTSDVVLDDEDVQFGMDD